MQQARDDTFSFELSGHPPLEDAALAEKICDAMKDGKQYLSLKFSGKPKTLETLQRVLKVSHDGLGIFAAELHINELSFLRGYEQERFRQTHVDPHIMSHVERASIAVKFQPRTWRQTQELSRMLYDARHLKELRLSLFEYPTDEFFNAPEYRSLDKYFTSSSMFAPMLNMQTRTERQRMEEERDAERIGQMLVTAITGAQTLRIENGTQMERLVDAMLTSPADGAGTMATIANPSPAAGSTELTSSSGSQSVTRYMKRQEWDETANAVLDRPLPYGLLSLKLNMLMPKLPCTTLLQSVNMLQKLDLGYCSIGDSSFVVLAPVIAQSMPELRNLILHRNALSDSLNLGSVVGPKLLSIDLSFNEGIGGNAATSLFNAIPRSALQYVDISHTKFRTEGLSFDALHLWPSPNAHLLIPNLFTQEEVGRIEQCMPDGGMLELVNPIRREGGSASNFMRYLGLLD